MDGYIEHGNPHACEIFLGNLSLIKSGLKVKNFVANKIEREASTGYSNSYEESFTEEVQRLSFKFMCAYIDTSGK